MTNAISIGATLSAAAGAAPARRAPSLDAELNTARAQLEDWVTCPSATTPEGKAKIAQLSAKAESIKSRIAQADATQDARRADAQSAARAEGVQRATGTARDAPAPPRFGSTLGGLLDTFA
jgi:septal ring factor EnvC (AmiA/AmiB activator)